MNDWDTFLQEERKKPYFIQLQEKLEQAYQTKTIFPPKEELFSCFSLCPYEKMKVLILGQDPYHGYGQSHGLCFSVKPGVKIPPSLKNIYKELYSDLGIESPNHGYLASWAKQGVLMMNTSWSVEEGKAASHNNLGWKTFSEHVLWKVNQKKQTVVCVLWGNHAIQIGKQCITSPQHILLTSAHPSPFSAHRGFFGSRPFSKTNAFLQENQLSPIDWRINDL